MTATNHALTGALLALVINRPAIVIPAALVSHFICDAIPHYTSDKPTDQVLKSNSFRNYLIVEAVLCLSLVIVLFFARPHDWFVPSLCAFLATSPDLLWINRYIKTRQGKPWRPFWFTKFAADIQWFARPIGLYVEIVWFTSAVLLLAPFIK